MALARSAAGLPGAGGGAAGDDGDTDADSAGAADDGAADGEAADGGGDVGTALRDAMGATAAGGRAAAPTCLVRVIQYAPPAPMSSTMATTPEIIRGVARRGPAFGGPAGTIVEAILYASTSPPST